MLKILKALKEKETSKQDRVKLAVEENEKAQQKLQERLAVSVDAAVLEFKQGLETTHAKPNR